jgi:glucose-1-phosphate thymidylyltransferase
MLGSGEQWGLTLSYKVQPKPEGIAQALILGEDFLGGQPVGLILGDNIFFGQGLSVNLETAVRRRTGATIFGYYVRDPQRYGVAAFDERGVVVDIEEKPASPKSNYAVTGLYFYDSEAASIARSIRPSARGELEITDVNKAYLDRGLLHMEILGRGIAWLDTGTHDSLMAAGQFVQTVEQRQGLKIACPEEIAFRKGYIDRAQLTLLAEPLKKSGYGEYLLQLLRPGFFA